MNLRETTDADIAIAFDHWQTFERISSGFPSLGDSGHRFEISHIPVDIIPFGPIESPVGSSSHPPHGDPMNVHGFADAYANAWTLPVNAETGIRIPTIGGYAALKAHAWLDRGEARVSFKDGPDLGLTVRWLATDTADLFDNHEQVIIQYQFKTEAAAAHLVGEAIADVLSPTESTYLATRFKNVNLDLLAQHIRPPDCPWTEDRNRAIVDALIAGLT